MSVNTQWQPLVQRAYDPMPARDGIDFVLTPQERDHARIFAIDLERQRRHANRRDEARALGVAGTVV